jgi:hypothetical protein
MDSDKDAAEGRKTEKSGEYLRFSERNSDNANSRNSRNSRTSRDFSAADIFDDYS